MMNKLIAVALILTVLFSVIPWEYCVAGFAFGLPFPVVFPSHGESGVHIFEFGSPPDQIIFSPLALFGNMAVSMVLLLPIIGVFLIGKARVNR